MLAVTERTDKKEYTSCIWEYIAEFIYKKKKKKHPLICHAFKKM